MRIPKFMIVAGEPSGDALAAELVVALRREFLAGPSPERHLQPLHTTLAPRFFGAGGPRLEEAGVDLAFDLTAHSVIGLADVFKRYLTFRRLFQQLLRLAVAQQPDVIVCVDFSGFNRRFAGAIRRHLRRVQGPGTAESPSLPWFHTWCPKIVQFVSPQVWASRESRVYQIAQDYDLLLSIFPFEKDWYAARVPQFRVEFVGHPMLDRYPPYHPPPSTSGHRSPPTVLLLPGSRESELRRHVPVLTAALAMIRATFPDARARMVLPNNTLAQQARAHGLPPQFELRVGALADSLREADVALASTGTVTMECSYFRVPTVALYKTSWLEYQIGRRIVKVNYLAMPNLLCAGPEPVFPEFIQHHATPQHISKAAVDFLKSPERRQQTQARLDAVIQSLGVPGAAHRAAGFVAEVWRQKQ